jgi:hypothetical protein
MSDSDYTPPPRLTAFGDALAHLAERLRAGLAEPPASFAATHLAGPASTLDQHFDIIENAAVRITRRFNTANDDVLANADATEADAHRAVGLIEAEIDRLLEGRAAAAWIVAPPLTLDARRLLPAVYEHTLREILAWLDGVIPIFIDPRATLEARGLWNDAQPVIEVETCLTLTAAPELHELTARLQNLSEDDYLDVLDEWEALETPRTGLPSPATYRTPARRRPTTSYGFCDTLASLFWSFVRVVAWLILIAFIVSLY